MNKLTDKLILFILCTALYLPNVHISKMIVPILITIILSSVFSYFENDFILVPGFISFLVLCFYYPYMLYFIPLICYDMLLYKIKWIWILSLVPLIKQSMESPISFAHLFIALFIVIAFLFKYRTISLDKIKDDYYRLRDNYKEMALQYEKKNKEFMEKQDYEINLATLNERNRIARDIHDNVGHMLSSSILQVGAMLATCKDDNTKQSLGLIKETLSKAMNSIRNSVHDLHDESVDLYIEIKTIINDFKFCPVDFDYDIESNPDIKLKYCFITVIKEALANIIKHSNADKVSVILREHPAIYQLVIQDNGTDLKYNSENGIGISNIKDRVKAFSGNLNINTENGFRIFISIPKQ